MVLIFSITHTLMSIRQKVTVWAALGGKMNIRQYHVYTASWSRYKGAYDQSHLWTRRSSSLSQNKTQQSNKNGEQRHGKELEFCSEARWNSQAHWVSEIHPGLQSVVLAPFRKTLPSICVLVKNPPWHSSLQNNSVLFSLIPPLSSHNQKYRLKNLPLQT